MVPLWDFFFFLSYCHFVLQVVLIGWDFVKGLVAGGLCDTTNGAAVETQAHC